MTDKSPPARPIESLTGGNKNGAWKPNPFAGEPEQEGYQAFKTCGPGDVMSIDLVPADTGREGYEIGYFQNWTVRYLADSSVAILCPAAGLIVFIEGRNLGELRKRLRERRIAAIYEHNPATYGVPPNNAAVVTAIKVEMSGDLNAIHGCQKP
jgi:hypothetical protein